MEPPGRDGKINVFQIVIEANALPGRACGGHREDSVGLQVEKQVLQKVPADRPSVVFTAEATLTADLKLRGKAIHGQGGWQRCGRMPRWIRCCTHRR